MCSAGQSTRRVPPTRRGFRPLLVVTAWLVGLLVALMAGMLSLYLVLSVLYAGSRVFARLRSGAEAGRRFLGSGGSEP